MIERNHDIDPLDNRNEAKDTPVEEKVAPTPERQDIKEEESVDMDEEMANKIEEEQD